GRTLRGSGGLFGGRRALPHIGPRHGASPSPAPEGRRTLLRGLDVAQLSGPCRSAVRGAGGREEPGGVPQRMGIRETSIKAAPPRPAFPSASFMLPLRKPWRSRVT